MKDHQQRRQIHVGGRVVTGRVCELCTVPIVIYPASTMARHLELHAAAAIGPQRLNEPRARYRRGRPPSMAVRRYMTSTGVIHKKGVR